MQSPSPSSPSSSNLPPTYIEGWSDRNSIASIPYRQLARTDIVASLISFGAAHVGMKLTRMELLDEQRELEKYSPDNVRLVGVDEAIKAIRLAIRLGINFIDTSPFYGRGLSELVVGQALREVPRGAYYIATKVGRHRDCTFDYSGEAVRRSVAESLVRLNVSYIDLLQIHDVEFADVDVLVNETLPAVDVLRKEGKVRFIGITGYPLHVLKLIIERSSVSIDTVLSYCRYTLFDQDLVEFLPFFEHHQLGVVNAALLGMGLFCHDRPLPAWHPAPEDIHHACQRAVKLCQAHSLPLPKLVCQYVMTEPRIHTHLLGMETEAVVLQNIATMCTKPTQEEQRILQRLLEEIFAPSRLKVRNWENVELERYRTDPKKFIEVLRGGAAAEDEDNENRTS